MVDHRQHWLLPLLMLLTFVAAEGCKKPGTGGSGAGKGISTASRDSDLDPILRSGVREWEGSKDVGKNVSLIDVTQTSGINFNYRNGRESKNNSILESLGGGAAILDFDRNGQLDIFFPGGGSFEGETIRGLPSALYRNLGDLTFDDVSQASGVTGQDIYSHGCHTADYNADGFPDVLVTGYGGLRLYQNQGDGTFREVHQEAGLTDKSWSSSAGWADFNNDGHLDLFVCHYVNWSFANNPVCAAPQPGLREICPPKMFDGLTDIVYFAKGDGTFEDVTKKVGIVEGGKGLGVIISDFDLDGDQDAYVANDTTANFLYLNDGKGVFTEEALLNSVALDGLGGANGSMGVDVGDYNNDGRLDLWVANYEQEAFALYENQGQARFLPASDKTGITSLGGLFVGFGTAFWDIDRDGFQDLVVANGHVINFPPSGQVLQLPLLLMNQGGRRYLRKQFDPGLYFSTPHSGRGLALGDLDNDGRLDLVISNNQSVAAQPAAILHNQTSDQNNWLQVRLVGQNANRDGIGARLVLHTSQGDRLRMIKGGGSYLSQNDYVAAWGVPKGDEITGLSVYWPGSADPIRYDKIALNQSVTLIEGVSGK